MLLVCVCSLSHVRFFMIPWTVASQAPLSMEFSKQEYWSGLPIPFPGDFPNPGNELKSSTLQADSLPSDMQAFKFYTERAMNLEVNSFPNFVFVCIQL